MPRLYKHSVLVFSSIICLSLITVGACRHANQSTAEAVSGPTDIPNLLTFWDFQEPTGTDRVSVGRYEYALKEMNGPVKRVEDGIFGPYGIDLEWGQWFRIQRQNGPGLDLHGDDQEVTMVAWIKRESDRHWQFIAGMWNEGSEEFKGEVQGSGEGAPTRQYALFTSGHRQSDHTTYTRTPANHQTHGYVSAVGGATPDRPFAFSYATGGTTLQKNRWYMIAYTYDGEQIKVYLNGQFDKNGNYNPFVYDEGILDAGEDGSDFTVAQRSVPGWTTFPEGNPPRDIGFSGHMGGLAVYDRALTAEEMANLYRGTME